MCESFKFPSCVSLLSWIATRRRRFVWKQFICWSLIWLWLNFSAVFLHRTTEEGLWISSYITYFEITYQEWSAKTVFIVHVDTRLLLKLSLKKTELSVWIGYEEFNSQSNTLKLLTCAIFLLVSFWHYVISWETDLSETWSEVFDNPVLVLFCIAGSTISGHNHPSAQIYGNTHNWAVIIQEVRPICSAVWTGQRSETISHDE